MKAREFRRIPPQMQGNFGVPKKGSLRDRMLDYFEEHPEGTLTKQQASAMFECSERVATVTLSLLKAEGALENKMLWRKAKMNTIEEFLGPYRFLSNFFPVRVSYEGDDYPTVEHAYQAAKTLDASERLMIRHAKSPGHAKRLGRKVAMRPDWDHVKQRVMLDLLRLKFTQHADLRLKLIATGNTELVEGNAWGDTYWGKYGGVGANHLGKLLMQVRTEVTRGLAHGHPQSSR